MSEKKKNAMNPPPVHSIVCGEIRADIAVRQSHSGYLYHDFSCYRQFACRSSGKITSSTSFFARNRDDLMQVTREASDWINQQVAISPLNEPAVNCEKKTEAH
jgi:hypothetical protein